MPNSSNCNPNKHVVVDPITAFASITFARPKCIILCSNPSMHNTHRFHRRRNSQWCTDRTSPLLNYRSIPAHPQLVDKFARIEMQTWDQPAKSYYSRNTKITYYKWYYGMHHILLEIIRFLRVFVTACINIWSSRRKRGTYKVATWGSGWTWMIFDFVVPSLNEESIIGMRDVLNWILCKSYCNYLTTLWPASTRISAILPRKFEWEWPYLELYTRILWALPG